MSEILFARLDEIISLNSTGTSGHKIPFLDGNNTWSGTNNFTSSISIFGPLIVGHSDGTNAWSAQITTEVGRSGGLKVQADANMVSSGDTEAAQFYCNSNATTRSATFWCQYLQLNISAGANIGSQVFITEASINNNNPGVASTPFSVNVGSSAIGYRMNCIGTTPCTSAFEIVDNGQPFYHGYMVGINSLVTSTITHPPAYSMPSGANGYSIAWYKDNVYAAPSWQIYSNSTTTAGNEFIFADNGFSWKNGGSTYFASNTTGASVLGTFTVTGTSKSALHLITNASQDKLQFTAASGSILTGISIGRSLGGGDANDFFIYNQTSEIPLMTISGVGGLTFSQYGAGVLQTNASGVITSGALSPSSINLANTHILVGNGSGLAVDVALSGDATIANTGVLTLATVNVNVGTFGSATQVAQPTINAKGLTTAVSNVTITPAVGSITGLGAGVAAWLAMPSSANLASAVTDETGTGALVFGTTPTLATPVINGLPTGTGVASANTVSTLVARDGSGNFSAGTIAAALSGNATTATSATTATNVINTAITDDATTNAAMNLTWVTSNTGNLPQKTTSSKLNFNPFTGALSSTSFSGAGTGLTGTANSLTAGNVTTNANLTGDITSIGNATTLTNAPVIAKVLTAFASGTGTVSATDTILTAFQKLDGNIALKASLASPTFTGTPLTTTAAVDTNTTQIASTAFVVAQAASATPLIDGTATVGTSLRFARGDHIHPTDTSRAATASPTFTGTATFAALTTSGLATVNALQVTNAAQAKFQFTDAAGNTAKGFSFGRSIGGGDAHDFFVYDQTNSALRFSISGTGAVVVGGAFTALTLNTTTAPTAVSGAGPFLVGSGSTLNNRMKVNLNGTDYWIPVSTTAF